MKEKKPGSGRIKLATLPDVVRRSKQLDRRTADESWLDADRGELKTVLDDLLMAIIHLRKPGRRTLLQRLISAEAERLRGSVLSFERVLDTIPVAVEEGEVRKGGLVAGDQLNVAVSTFIALADGVR